MGAWVVKFRCVGLDTITLVLEHDFADRRAAQEVADKVNALNEGVVAFVKRKEPVE